MKAWTSSIARTSSKPPSNREPPSTSTFVMRRPPSSASRASRREAGRDCSNTTTSQPASTSRLRSASFASGPAAIRTGVSRAVRTNWLREESDARLSKTTRIATRGPDGLRRQERVIALGGPSADENRIHAPAEGNT